MERLEPRRVFNGGAVDLHFGDHGVARVAFPPPDPDPSDFVDGQSPMSALPLASAVAPDGKIVVAGSAENHAKALAYVALARFNADGTPDASFGRGGTVLTYVGPGRASASRMVLQADDKILVAGTGASPAADPADAGNFGAFFLARYNPDGSPDATFGRRGEVFTDFGPTDDGARGLALQPDGKIVASGWAGDDQAVARYNADGSPDATFGQGGRVLTAPPPSVDGGFPGNNFPWIDGAGGVAVLPDGRLLVVGGRSPDDLVSSQTVLAFYRPDGTLDSLQTDDEAFVAGYAQNFAVLPGGKVLVFNYRSDNYTGGRLVGRYNADGTPDPTFADPRKGPSAWNLMNTLGEGQALPDGKIVVAGDAYSFSSGAISVARLNADGTPDLGFGVEGLSVAAASGGVFGGTTLAVAPDGSVYAAGSTYDSGGAAFVVARFLPHRGPAPASASLTPVASDYAGPKTGPLRFVVTYRGGGGIYDGSIGGSNLVIVRDDGNPCYAGVGHVALNPDGSLTVTYVAYEGLSSDDNGDYTLSVVFGSVYARDGGSVPGQVLGRFTLRLPADGAAGQGNGPSDGAAGPVSALDPAGSADDEFADPAALTNHGLAGDAPATPADSTAADGFLRSVESAPDTLASTGGADDAAVWE